MSPGCCGGRCGPVHPGQCGEKDAYSSLGRRVRSRQNEYVHPAATRSAGSYPSPMIGPPSRQRGDVYASPAATRGAGRSPNARIDPGEDVYASPAVTRGAERYPSARIDSREDVYASPAVTCGAGRYPSARIDPREDVYASSAVGRGAGRYPSARIDLREDAYASPAATRGAGCYPCARIDPREDVYASPSSTRGAGRYPSSIIRPPSRQREEVHRCQAANSGAGRCRGATNRPWTREDVYVCPTASRGVVTNCPQFLGIELPRCPSSIPEDGSCPSSTSRRVRIVGVDGSDEEATLPQVIQEVIDRAAKEKKKVSRVKLFDAAVMSELRNLRRDRVHQVHPMARKVVEKTQAVEDKSPPYQSSLLAGLESSKSWLTIESEFRHERNSEFQRVVERLARAEASCYFDGAVQAAEAAAAKAPPELREEAALEGARNYQAMVMDSFQGNLPGPKPIEVIGYIGITGPK